MTCVLALVVVYVLMPSAGLVHVKHTVLGHIEHTVGAAQQYFSFHSRYCVSRHAARSRYAAI